MISAVFALPQALRIKEELCFLLNLLYSSVPLRLLPYTGLNSCCAANKDLEISFLPK